MRFSPVPRSSRPLVHAFHHGDDDDDDGVLMMVTFTVCCCPYRNSGLLTQTWPDAGVARTESSYRRILPRYAELVWCIHSYVLTLPLSVYCFSEKILRNRVVPSGRSAGCVCVWECSKEELAECVRELAKWSSAFSGSSARTATCRIWTFVNISKLNFVSHAEHFNVYLYVTNCKNSCAPSVYNANECIGKVPLYTAESQIFLQED